MSIELRMYDTCVLVGASKSLESWRRNRQLRRNFHRTDHRRPPSPPSLNRLPAPPSYIATNLKKFLIFSLEIITSEQNQGGRYKSC
ncbi:hypothetical protein F2Q69_00049681 [Brassica cretica]|uniref:Uncharacterized protein n=1 Tax=Brassica cretica TaxID=69181 RepID=A0A8S9PX38_BRACR|nr:hypothetical protein F2Q69_00049681 [Brassica cretica]